MSAPKKVNYLNNKDILKEIHKSKMTFCFVEKDQYNQFDIEQRNGGLVLDKQISLPVQATPSSKSKQQRTEE